MTLNTRTTVLDRSLEGRRLLDHPFYRRWERGELGEGELTQYAQQYRYFETMLPDFLDALAGDLPAGEARAAILANRADEVSEPSHLSLFERFAAHYDASPVPASSATVALLASYTTARTTSPAAGVAGLLAYEIQGAEIARTKAAGLRDFYGADADATLFWDAHSVLEQDHANWTLDALAALSGDEAEIEAAASAVATAWWEFLDEREALATH